MKFFQYKNFLFFLGIVIFGVSCGITESQVANPSSDASVLTAYIQYNDSSPNASKAVFTINNVDSTIYNVDSLPYGTRLDSLYLGFTFASSLGYVMNDTVAESYYYGTAVTSKAYDLTNPAQIKNLASDGESTRQYTIEVRVHKVETYLHVWSELKKYVTNAPAENQKAVMLKNKFYYFHNYGTHYALYTSADAANWTQQAAPATLPPDAELRNMLVYKDEILLLYNGNELYKSADGINWQKHTLTADPDYNYQSLMFQFKNKLWAVAQHKTNKSVRISSSSDGITWTLAEKRSFTNFPVRDFSVTKFKPSLGREKVIVLGGVDASGKTLNTRWSAEDVLGVDTLYWVNLQHKTYKMDQVKQAATAYYGSKLLIIGGSKPTGLLVDAKEQLRQSIDEGLTFAVPDSTQNLMPDEYPLRTNASLIHDTANNTLYVIGGKTNTSTLADVWKIKVNFYNFKDYLENPAKY